MRTSCCMIKEGREYEEIYSRREILYFPLASISRPRHLNAPYILYYLYYTAMRCSRLCNALVNALYCLLNVFSAVAPAYTKLNVFTRKSANLE